MRLETEPSQSAAPRTPRIGHDKNTALFFLALTAITLLSLAIRFYVASKSFMDFDEWEHVFIASAPRLTDFHYLTRLDAHPVLFYRMLRVLLHFGHNIFLYRLIPVLAGGASVFLVGLICRKVCRYPVIALLASAAFALSSVAITISTEVRAYELSVCFALLAVFFYLDLISIDNPARLRTYIGFTGAMCIALEADYFAAFVFGACIAFFTLVIVGSKQYRERLFSPGKRRHLLFFLLSLVAPACVLTAMYVGPLSHQPIQGYLYNFYYGFTPGETRISFVIRNLLNEWNLFSPVAIHNAAILFSVLTVLTIVAGLLWFIALRANTTVSRRVPLPFAVLVTVELLVLSLTDAYPFGGLLRHQYILAPFLVIVAFSLADVIASKVVPTVRRAVPAVLAALILVHAAIAAPSLVALPGFTLAKHDYDAYVAAFPDARAVYLSHFTVIGYFINTASDPRRFIRRVDDPSLIDEFRMDVPGGRTVELFHDKDRYIPDLRDPALYRSFAACLRQSGVRELTLFHYVPGPGQLPETPEFLKKIITDTAAHEGLSVSKIIVEGKAVFAGFSLTS